MYDHHSLPRAADTGRMMQGRAAPHQVIDPKDRIAAWKRWEMTSFARDHTPAPAMATEPQPAPPPAAPAVDEAALDTLRLEARMSGEKAGYDQGYAKGQAEGHAAAMVAVHEQARQLRSLVQTWPAALHAAEQGVAEDLVALALDLARQVLGQALAAQPQAILAVVHDLLQAEPALVGSPQLLLHPDDGKIVSEVMEAELLSAGWRIRCDADIQRGGCRVLATSGERDATLPTRWERVAAALARHRPVPAGTGHG